MSVASVSQEMLVLDTTNDSHHQPQQPFSCFINLLDSTPPSTLLTAFDSSTASTTNTLYIHLVASLVVFAHSIQSDSTWSLFEAALFEALVCCDNIVVAMLILEVLLSICDDVHHQMITHWIEITFKIIDANQSNSILCSLCGTFAKLLIDKETEKLSCVGLLASQRDWFSCANNEDDGNGGVLVGVGRWMWTCGGTGRRGEEQTSALYLDLALSLWNSFLEMLDTDGNSTSETITALQGFSFPLRLLNASVSQLVSATSNSQVVLQEIVDVVIFLIDGMSSAFDTVLSENHHDNAAAAGRGGGGGVMDPTNQVIIHMYRTVSELLELASSLHKYYSPEQRVQIIQTLESWIDPASIVNNNNNGNKYLPQTQSIDLIRILRAMK
ncbi:hypothetical protein BDR26DRAFT_858439 [Obelidium mucronatum]|nr:hypothetical protein BDR26DRAFT_858439 [Obelidium mucronatum]